MAVVVFGNYAFAAAVSQALLDRGQRIAAILANVTAADDRYGPGVVQWADSHRIRVERGRFSDHAEVVRMLRPSYAISAAYKQVIDPSAVGCPVFGIHFGGLFGTQAIRGSSTSVWSRLSGQRQSSLSLYRLDDARIDSGVLLHESVVPLGETREQDAQAQLRAMPDLVNRLQQLLNSSTEVPSIPTPGLGPYYPRAELTRYTPSLYSREECDKLEAIGARADSRDFAAGDVGLIHPTDESLIKREVVYLHGLASSFPSLKLQRSADLLGDARLHVPLLAGIERRTLDGQSCVDTLQSQLRRWIRFADDRHACLICSSVSGLLAAPLLRELGFKGHVIFVTPVMNVVDGTLDPALRAPPDADTPFVELTGPRYSGLRMNRQLVEWLRGLSLPESLARRGYGCDVVFAREDEVAPAERAVDELVGAGIPANRVNVFAGGHEFNSLLQLSILASLVKRIPPRVPLS